MGTFRFFLALNVMVLHLSGYGDHLAMTSVFCFYVISGYLITRILSETYNAPVTGLVAFAANRTLRIFPTYWTIALIGLALAALLPAETARLHASIRVPGDAGSILSNLFIFGLTPASLTPGTAPVRLVPPAWSLSIELMHYVVMAAGVARSRTGALVWWCAGAGIAAWALLFGRIEHAYFTVWGPTVCFATGALLHHFGAAAWGRPRKGIAIRLLPFALALAAGLAPEVLGDRSAPLFLYLSAAAAAAAVTLLAEGWGQGGAPAWDRFLGDVSYPLFLCHWHVGILVSAGLLGGAPVGPALLAAALPFAVALAASVVLGVERPVQRLRARLRRAAVAARGEAAQPVPVAL